MQSFKPCKKNYRYDLRLITDKTSFKNSIEQRTLTVGNYTILKLARSRKGNQAILYEYNENYWLTTNIVKC